MTYMLNTSSAKRLCLLHLLLWPYKIKKKHKHLKKHTPRVGGTTSPRCVLFHGRFPQFFLAAKAVNDVTRSMDSYDSTLKTCQTRQRREGAKEGHDIYPVDVITKIFRYLYKLNGYGLCKGKPTPKTAL